MANEYANLKVTDSVVIKDTDSGEVFVDTQKSGPQNLVQGNIKATGHVKIVDDLGNVLVDKDNAINFENMSLAIAQSLSSLTTLGPIYEMAFGNGGSTVSGVGTVTYLTPNTIGANAQLYNQTFAQIVNGLDPNNTNPSQNFITVSHINGNLFTDIIINCTLTVGEPAGQEAIDQTTNLNGTYVFDELGILDYQGSLLTHVIFSPVQKSSNRSFSVTYTIRIQLV